MYMNTYTHAGELRATLGQHPLDNQPRSCIGYTYLGGGGAERGGQEEDRSGESFFFLMFFIAATTLSHHELYKSSHNVLSHNELYKSVPQSLFISIQSYKIINLMGLFCLYTCSLLPPYYASLSSPEYNLIR